MLKMKKLNITPLDYVVLSPIRGLLNSNRIQTVEGLIAYKDNDGNNILTTVIRDLSTRKATGSSDLINPDNLIRYLIDSGVDINQSNNKNLFPLDYATQFRFKNIITILLERDLHIQNSLNIAYKKRDAEILCLLLTKVPEYERREVMYECYRNKYILDSRYKTGNQGYNAMHDAILKNDIEEFKFILSTIDSPNTQTLLEDYSPLHLICKKPERLQMVDIIINKRANLIKSIYGDALSPENLNVNIQDKNHDTPMHILLRESNGIDNISQYIRLLCQKSADVSIRNNEGYNPIHVAISSGGLNEDALRILIAQGGENIDLNELLSFAEEKNNVFAKRIIQDYIDSLAFCFIRCTDLKDSIPVSDKPIVNIPSNIKLPEDPNINQQNQGCRLM